MSKETTYDINPDQLSEIGLTIRRETSDYVWLEDEFRNAIFETLVDQYNLPWDENIGCPDWNDPCVQRLYRAFAECLQKENDIEIIDGIKGRCTTKDCRWKTVGQARVEKTDRILGECDLTEKCRDHHLDSGELTKHNRFVLYKRDKQVGVASVSSQVCTGYIEPLEANF